MFDDLRQPIALEDLILHNNLITDKGFDSIMKPIKAQLFQPKRLCLSSNQITDHSVHQLINYQKETKELKSLNELLLRRNYISHDAALALLDHIKTNIQLTKVDILFSRKHVMPDVELAIKE